MPAAIPATTWSPPETPPTTKIIARATVGNNQPGHLILIDSFCIGAATKWLEAFAHLSGPALLLCQGWARFQRVEDDAGELPFEAADRFATALPLRLFALEVGASSGVHTCLRNRDSIEGGVELAVAAAVETVPLDAA